jgi:HAD superfamily hydrolase (TIGR01549 family)
VISNNSVDAVVLYLQRHHLLADITQVVARSDADPSLMKPNLYLVNKALSLLGADASRSVFIGDSVSDMQAAKSAGVSAVGYANRPGKAERLSDAGADAARER